VRVLLLVVLLSSSAHADGRFDVHVGGGLEGGLIQGEPQPGLIAELGVGADYFAPDRKWGLGVVLERVGRRTADVSIAHEHKLDVVFRITHPKNRCIGGVGMGIRQLSIDAGKASTVWGVDLARMTFELPLARAGRVGVQFYFTWTFGLYHGELYGERFGDMPYPTKDYTTIASSYVLGLQTSIDTH